MKVCYGTLILFALLFEFKFSCTHLGVVFCSCTPRRGTMGQGEKQRSPTAQDDPSSACETAGGYQRRGHKATTTSCCCKVCNSMQHYSEDLYSYLTQMEGLQGAICPVLPQNVLDELSCKSLWNPIVALFL